MSIAKKTSKLIAAALFLTSAAWAEELVVPFDSEYPPLSFRGADGEAVGFDVAVARALAEELDAALRFEPADFFDIQSGNWPAEWAFAVASMTATDQRKEMFDFIGPYYFDFVVLIGRKTVGEELDIPGKGDSIGVCSGCVYRAFLEGNYQAMDGTRGVPRYPGSKIVEFATDSDMLRALVSGDADGIDFGVTSARFAEYFRDLGFNITLSSDTVFITPAFIAVPKLKELGADELDAAFRQLVANGTISELSIEFLERDYTDPGGGTGADSD